VCLGGSLDGSLDGLNSQLDPVGAPRRGAQTGVSRFTIDIFGDK